jgi:Bacterial PH domain
VEQIIRFSRLKLLLPFIPLAILLGISIALNLEGWRDASWWLYAILGGVFAFFVTGNLYLPRSYYLRLAADGLTVAKPIGTRHYRWSEVRGFRVSGMTVNGVSKVNQVAFDFSEDSPLRTVAVKASRLVTGYDSSFAAMYAIDAEDVARLLNEWQQRLGALEVRPPHPDLDRY